MINPDGYWVLGTVFNGMFKRINLALVSSSTGMNLTQSVQINILGRLSKPIGVILSVRGITSISAPRFGQ